MQSGISASQELVSQFNNFLSDNSIFALLVTITGEALTPVTELPATSTSDFAANLDLLTPHLQPTEALYLLLREYGKTSDAGKTPLLAVTYVPDTAKVRQKMLFASTRLTLVRELGKEHFPESLLVTMAEELTPAGFERHARHAALDAPLTEEERTLGEVRRAEAEAGSGTAVRELTLSKNMNMPITDDALAALKSMEQGQINIVTLKINPASEIVELVEAPASAPTTVDELVAAISPTEPRFTFWRFTHTHNGEESSPVLFFYTCVAAAGKSIKDRMMYPLMKRAVITGAEQAAGLKVEKRFEVEETSEITEASIMNELHPKAEVKTAFKRPKRPGR